MSLEYTGLPLTYIAARDLPEAWFRCLRALMEPTREGVASGIHEYAIQRGSYVGARRREFDFITVHIERPWSLPLVPDVPDGIPAPTSMAYVEEYLQYLMCDSKTANEQYTYGEDLAPQIEQVIEMYRVAPATNQAYMAVGNRDSILLDDPPCLRGIDTRILNARLHFMVYFRSWDLWGGFPSNLAAIELLKQYMADAIGVGNGEIIAMSKGLHLYDNSGAWGLARKVVGLD